MGRKKEKIKELLRDKTHEDRGHYSKGRAAAVLSVISVITGILTVLIFLFIKREFQENNVLRDWASEHPILGSILMTALCAVQVVVALVPGELVELASGYVFGAFWGTVLCLAGITLGSVCAIVLTRRFGRKLVESFYPREKLESLPILNDPSRRNALTALLFFIPGTPKDLLTYVIGLTDMSVFRYILLTTLCRLPSVLMSTLSGDALGDNSILRGIWFLIATGAVSAAGYFIYLTIQRRSEKRKNQKKKENQKQL